MVGHVARCENERRLLAMQVCELGLQLHQRAIRARDVARAARTRTHSARGGAHRFDHFRVLAHCKIIVRAPNDDIPLAVRTVPNRERELSCFALEISEDAIAALTFQSRDGRFETADIVEHSREFLW